MEGAYIGMQRAFMNVVSLHIGIVDENSLQSLKLALCLSYVACLVVSTYRCFGGLAGCFVVVLSSCRLYCEFFFFEYVVALPL